MAVAAALLAASVGTSSSANASKPVDDRIVLRATTVIEGNRTAYVPVRLPSPATVLNAFGRPELTQALEVQGSGPAGFVLLSEKRRGPVLIGSTTPAGVVGSNYAVMHFGGERRNGNEEIVMPPGDYRLYLVTQRPRTRVVLRLKGLTGSTRLSPRTPAQGLFETPKPFVQGTAEKLVYSNGATSALDGPNAVQLMIGLARHEIHAESVHMFCGYKGRKSSPGPYCPGPASTIYPSVVSFETVDGLTHGLVAAAVHEQVGEQGTGYSMTTTTPAEHVGYQNLWVSFDYPD